MSMPTGCSSTCKGKKCLTKRCPCKAAKLLCTVLCHQPTEKSCENFAGAPPPTRKRKAKDPEVTILKDAMDEVPNPDDPKQQPINDVADSDVEVLDAGQAVQAIAMAAAGAGAPSSPAIVRSPSASVNPAAGTIAQAASDSASYIWALSSPR